jgi:hypothetical protein
MRPASAAEKKSGSSLLFPFAVLLLFILFLMTIFIAGSTASLFNIALRHEFQVSIVGFFEALSDEGFEPKWPRGALNKCLSSYMATSGHVANAGSSRTASGCSDPA